MYNDETLGCGFEIAATAMQQGNPWPMLAHYRRQDEARLDESRKVVEIINGQDLGRLSKMCLNASHGNCLRLRTCPGESLAIIGSFAQVGILLSQNAAAHHAQGRKLVLMDLPRTD